MQLGDPSVLETSSGEPGMAAAPAATTVAPPLPPPAPEAATGPDADNGNMMMNMMMMDATNSGDDNNNNNNNNKGLISSGGGNRWPRQETFALLKIRSDMDATFRDSSLKGPLWEEVSRKLAELGYNRSAKKCKEKFENVYKYHKRTKESRSGKPEGKTYKFFDQLQALENQFSISHASKLPPPSQPQPQLQPQSQSQLQPKSQSQLQSQSRPSNDPTTTISFIAAPTTTTTIATTNATINPPSNITTTTITNPRNLPNMNFFSSTTTTTTTSTSSSTASDEDMEERYRKKRKLKDYFRRLTRQVLAKQEEMQKRFLEAIDKRERDRAAQQEAWRVQEMARINREHDILVQERSTAAAKDAAVIAFLQKLSGGPPNPIPPPPLTPANPPQAAVTTQPAQAQAQTQVQVQPRQDQQPQPFSLPSNNHFEVQKANSTNGHQIGTSSASSSRWPKPEVHALIRLRTSMDSKYQENGPKGPLWEDISAGMQRLGYNRSSKRCKEKWENINKYFKKVKESNKHRREDSKTCPYFHELDALYKEKIKSNNNNNNNNNNGNHNNNNNANLFGLSKPNHVAEMMMEPLMVQPEQQWRPPPLDQEGVNINNASHNNVMKQREGEEEELEDDDDDNMEDEEDLEEDEDEEDGESLEEDDQEGRYEIAATNNNNNKQLPSVGTHS